MMHAPDPLAFILWMGSLNTGQVVSLAIVSLVALRVVMKRLSRII